MRVYATLSAFFLASALPVLSAPAVAPSREVATPERRSLFTNVAKVGAVIAGVAGAVDLYDHATGADKPPVEYIPVPTDGSSTDPTADGTDPNAATDGSNDGLYGYLPPPSAVVGAGQ